MEFIAEVFVDIQVNNNMETCGMFLYHNKLAKNIQLLVVQAKIVLEEQLQRNFWRKMLAVNVFTET